MNSNISKTNAVSGSFTIIDPMARTNGLLCFSSPCEISLRGATSLTFAKKNYKIKLTDELGQSLDANVLGIRNDDAWLLHAMGADPSRMRNQICTDVWNSFSALQPGNEKMIRNGISGQYVEVILNGNYIGLYYLSDKINRRLLGLKKEGERPKGLLLKCHVDFTSLRYLTMPENAHLPSDGDSYWYDWDMKYPNEPTLLAWKPFVDLIQFTSSTTVQADSVSAHFNEHFYRHNAIDYFIMVYAFKMGDNFFSNTYFSLTDMTQDQRFWITPWDMDYSFGRDGWGKKANWSSDDETVIHTSQPFRTFVNNNDELWMNDVIERWTELLNGALNEDSIAKRLDTYASLFERSGAWQRERELWNWRIVLPNQSIIELPENIHSETEYMKQWYTMNLHEMFTSFTSISNQYVHHTISVYTLDGRKLPFTEQQQIGTLPHGIYIINGKKIVR